MTITLTVEEESELWAEADRNSLQKSKPEPFETFSEIPKQFGKGYIRHIELYPQLDLAILDYEYHDEALIKNPDWDHPLQFLVLLSGRSIDEYGGQVGDKLGKDIRVSLVRRSTPNAGAVSELRIRSN